MSVLPREIAACAEIVRRRHGATAVDRIARYQALLLSEGNESAAAIWSRVMDHLRGGDALELTEEARWQADEPALATAAAPAPSGVPAQAQVAAEPVAADAEER
jgi:hypothetical protein